MKIYHLTYDFITKDFLGTIINQGNVIEKYFDNETAALESINNCFEGFKMSCEKDGTLDQITDVRKGRNIMKWQYGRGVLFAPIMYCIIKVTEIDI